MSTKAGEVQLVCRNQAWVNFEIKITLDCAIAIQVLPLALLTVSRNELALFARHQADETLA